ncbi:MAG: FkbM family methyltransferase [Ignavibacteriales bacterium]|nr:FkbM family methyltransferase [Ignavibacteriales bacterium]
MVKNFFAAVINVLKRLLCLKDRLPLQAFLESRVGVVDVGARGGYHPRWDQFGDRLRVHLFEPEKNGYEELVKIFGKDERVRLYNVALSERDETLSLNVTAWSPSTTVYEIDHAFLRQTNMGHLFEIQSAATIEATTLSKTLDEPVDFIKLDVEGHELAILKGASEETFDGLIGVESEIAFLPWRKGAPVFGDVDAFLRDKGFSLCELTRHAYHYRVPTKRLEAHGFVFGGDVLYFRTPTLVVENIESGKWDRSKWEIATGLYLAYGNFEFAHKLLTLAEERGYIISNDPKAKLIRKMIAARSGFGRPVPFKVIKALREFLVRNPELDY